MNKYTFSVRGGTTEKPFTFNVIVYANTMNKAYEKAEAEIEQIIKFFEVKTYHIGFEAVEEVRE